MLQKANNLLWHKIVVPENVVIKITLQSNFTITRLYWCWNNFLGLRWICSCLECQIRKPKDNFHVPWPETQYIQSANPKTPTLGLIIPNKVDYVVPDNQIFSIYIFLFLCSLSYKSFLPSAPFCSSLRLSTSWNIK